MDWIFFAFLTPLLFSIVVLIDDHLLHNVYRSPHVGAVISGFFGLLPLISLLWLDVQPVSQTLFVLAVVGGFLNIMYYYFYFVALERDSPSIVVALFALTPAILPFLAYIFLDERLSYQQLVGFSIVLVFTFLLTAVDIKKFKFSTALLPIAVASLLIGFSLISSKYVYDRVEFYTGYMYFSLGMGLGALFFCYLLFFHNRYNKQKKRTKRLKGTHLIGLLAVLAVAEIINLAAEFSSNVAVSRGPVSLVELIQNTQPMYMLLIAVALYPFFPRFFREAEEGRVKFKLLMMTGIIGGLAITLI